MHHLNLFFLTQTAPGLSWRSRLLLIWLVNNLLSEIYNATVNHVPEAPVWLRTFVRPIGPSKSCIPIDLYLRFCKSSVVVFA